MSLPAPSYDVIVLGLGAFGSAALYQLSDTKAKVLGIDRYAPPHSFGSSHGDSRIIRMAYYEDPVYVPWLRSSYKMWADLEKETGRQLFLKTGGLMLGETQSGLIQGSMNSARLHGLPYELLSSADLHSRFPAFQANKETVGVWEQEAGILFPELCIRTFLEEASRKGAETRYQERVLRIIPGRHSVGVVTDKAHYQTAKLLLTAGAWTAELLPDLQLPLSVARQPLYWFSENKPGSKSRYLPESMPVYIWELEEGRMFYGFPDLGNGIKIAWHHQGEPIRADELKQEVSQEEIEEMRSLASKYLGMDPHFLRSSVCMYTNTPDHHFIIDRHPARERIIIASPCSGHGFKFSIFIGKLLCDLAMDQEDTLACSPGSLDRFSLDRFSR